MQSNRKVQRRNTRTKTIMISYEPVTDVPVTSTGTNTIYVDNITPENSNHSKTNESKATSIVYNNYTDENKKDKIEIGERQYDFQTMRAIFENSHDKTNSSTIFVVNEMQTNNKKEKENEITNKIKIKTKKEKENEITSKITIQTKKEKENDVTSKIKIQTKKEKEKQAKNENAQNIETILHDSNQKDKQNERVKDHVNSHDKETVRDKNNEFDFTDRMYDYKHLINLWKDNSKKN